jgi:hypothetical protein
LFFIPTFIVQMKIANNITKYFRKVIVISITLIVCFLLLEIGLRSLGHIPSNMTDGFFEKYGKSYRLKTNLIKIVNWPSFSYIAYTNSFGFRDNKIGERNVNNKPYVVFLGGSDAFGNGVNYEDSFVGIFAEAASKNNIETLNIGVGGHFFEDQKALFLDFINNSPRKPSMVILCVNPINISCFDMQNENIVVKNGYLFTNRLWEIAYIKIFISNVSSAYCFFRDNIRKLSAKWTNYNVRTDQPFLETFHKNCRMFKPGIVMQFEDRLNRFEKYCTENNITLILVYLPLIDSFGLNKLLTKLGKNPEEYDTSYYAEIMKSYCNKKRLKLINTEPILKYYYDEGIQLRFDFDAHYNKYANRIVGEYIIEEMFSLKN